MDGAALTIIRATSPTRVCKSYYLGADGKLAKRAVAHITEGRAWTSHVPDAAALAALLAQVSEREDEVLCPGVFQGAEDEPFRLVAEKRLATLLGSTEGEVAGGVHTIGGERVAARLKRGIVPSAWLLIDADNPPGMPVEWRSLTLAERLALLDPVLPGIATCERVELRGSSARVMNGSGRPGGHTHAWIRVTDPARVEILRHATIVRAVNAGLAFKSPRYSRKGPSQIVGHAWRSVIDFAVWDAGRLVFLARPEVRAEGYSLADAGVQIVNPEGGLFDTSRITLPDRRALAAYRGRTGTHLDVKQEGDRIAVRSTGELTWETEIERRGDVRTLREWVATMQPQDKLRCETPFRASVSEAAVIRLGRDGEPVLHDVGSGITYHLAGTTGEAKKKSRGERKQHATTAGNAAVLLTEHGVAVAFRERHADRLRYCHDTGAWFVWTGVRWQQDRKHAAFSFARNLIAEANRDEELKVQAITGKAAFAGGVERFARADPALAVTAEAWNPDPWLLGTPTGTVDLHTGARRPARPEEMITRITAVAPSDDAECPLWLAFLKQATGGDEALIGFLQQWCGYCLTGATREHALLFIFGPGGNGKSVFLNVVTGILGEYHATAAMDVFTEAGGSRHLAFLAMLAGARMVTAAETEEGKPWAETRIKEITGGTPVTANFMRQNPFTFTPQFKITITGNHKPILRTVDDAARRRFNIVPFLYKPERPDRSLEEKLRREWPGILRWMIEGCIAYQQFGLMRPKVVMDATADYFDAQDVFGQWVHECCIVAPHLAERPGRLLDSFNAWASSNGEERSNRTALRGWVERQPGLRYKRIKGSDYIQGIGTRPPEGAQGAQGGA